MAGGQNREPKRVAFLGGRAPLWTCRHMRLLGVQVPCPGPSALPEPRPPPRERGPACRVGGGAGPSTSAATVAALPAGPAEQPACHGSESLQPPRAAEPPEHV